MAGIMAKIAVHIVCMVRTVDKSLEIRHRFSRLINVLHDRIVIANTVVVQIHRRTSIKDSRIFWIAIAVAAVIPHQMNDNQGLSLRLDIRQTIHKSTVIRCRLSCLADMRI